METNGTTTQAAVDTAAAEQGQAAQTAAAGAQPPAGETTVAELKTQLDQLLEAAKKDEAAPAAAPPDGKQVTEEKPPAETAEEPPITAEAEGEKDAEIARLRQQIAQREMRDIALEGLSKAGVPANIADLVDYSSKEAAQKSLEKIVSGFKDGYETLMKDKLGGETPPGLGSSKTSQQMLQAQIRKNIRGN